MDPAKIVMDLAAASKELDEDQDALTIEACINFMRKQVFINHRYHEALERIRDGAHTGGETRHIATIALKD